jgi:hypothetical protein
MRSTQVLFAIFVVCVLALNSCTASNQASVGAQQPLTTIPTTPGGIIEYGVVAGANTLPAAMASVLRQVHQACGEKPVVGQVFRVKGSNSAGVFFTVVDHAQGNRELAGLVIASPGSNQMEAAVVADSANRFGQTANGMLQQLFAQWNPGGTVAASGSAGGSSAAPASSTPAAENSGPVPILHTVAARDNSAAIGLPEGWTLDPRSSGGTVLVSGPHGEQIDINMSHLAIDPSNPSQGMMLQRMGPQPGTVYYPFRGDLVKSFPDMFQAWRRANGEPPARLQIDSIQPMPSQPNDHCAGAQGHVDLGKGMQAFNANMCAFNPTPQSNGMYLVRLSFVAVPNALADQEKSMMQTIVHSYNANQQVMNQETAAGIAKVNANTQGLIRESQMQVDRIHQIGAQATARMNATESANQAQWAGFDKQENNISRQGQGFSNYLLDQSVVQNNNVGGTGMVGHSTQWNSVANAMVQANPNKYEIVNTPNYWQGVDY